MSDWHWYRLVKPLPPGLTKAQVLDPWGIGAAAVQVAKAVAETDAVDSKGVEATDDEIEKAYASMQAAVAAHEAACARAQNASPSERLETLRRIAEYCEYLPEAEGVH